MKRNYKLSISYDGTRYYGWEHQPGNDMTIQGKLENVLEKMTGSFPDIQCSGRTDAGVHAKAMIASVVLDTLKSDVEIKKYMNRYLPEDICVNSVNVAGDRFHARYNARGKTYVYTCYVGDSKPVFDRKYVYALESCPDIGRMKDAAEYLMGEHDFASFCANPRMKKSTVRNVDTIDIRKKDDYVIFTYHGNGFLQHMVRILTGTLLDVGFYKRTPESVKELLEIKDRRFAGDTAPACGLCLEKVDYS